MFPSDSGSRPWFQSTLERTSVGWNCIITMNNCAEDIHYTVPIKSLEGYKILIMMFPKYSWAGISRSEIDKDFAEIYEKVKNI